MILNVDTIKNMLPNAVLADIYISHRINGETIRSLATRYKVDPSTIHDKYVRACHHIADELKRELARSEYHLGRWKHGKEKDWGNAPKNIFFVNGSTHKDTFTIPSIRGFVLPHCHGLVLNAFAGKTPLEKEGCTFVNNDLRRDIPTNFHLDVSSPEFVGELQQVGFTTFDTILVDPPFSLYLAKRKYNAEWIRDFTVVKNNLNKLARVGTKIITLGFNSTGMGKRRGYEKEELLIVNCKGTNNDVLCLVERKVLEVEEEGEGYGENDYKEATL